MPLVQFVQFISLLSWGRGTAMSWNQAPQKNK